MDQETLKNLDKNFTRLTQTLYKLGTIKDVKIEVFPHNKAFLIKKMRSWFLSAGGPFWYDLHKKNEAILADRLGDKIHFKIEAVDGSDYETYRDTTSQRHILPGR